MRTIAVFRSMEEAEIAKSVLEAEGIEALIPDSSTIGLNWTIMGALGGVRLQVAPEDVEDAVRCLGPSDSIENQPSAITSQDAREDVCPECGRALIFEPKHRKEKISLLFFPPATAWLALLLALWPGRKVRCQHCDR